MKQNKMWKKKIVFQCFICGIVCFKVEHFSFRWLKLQAQFQMKQSCFKKNIVKKKKKKICYFDLLLLLCAFLSPVSETAIAVAVKLWSNLSCLPLHFCIVYVASEWKTTLKKGPTEFPWVPSRTLSHTWGNLSGHWVCHLQNKWNKGKVY